ncbi:FmdE family protein [Methanotorris formicicus]|uniref:Formylmethanofuran dehydrogenase subunit E region n=1 Tax=Methanotorris formicicus Mc-S-70 TaxID=647171 RepID=H1L1M9_9EURY|nr:FmdE family protein [Methanotorris formicicus]EHP83598.1 formylmethanofuran dehydrogenase subunit E region [Methanotorris formicicus Mc-S-70]
MNILDDLSDKVEGIKKEDIEKILNFHGCLSPGALIGIQMFNLANKILKIKDGERIYAICETYNCLPDAFQILGGCTIGNKRLKVIDTGKMAVTVNKWGREGETVRGVRIILDPKKTIKYPKLHAWYLNIEKVPHDEVILDILNAGEDAYSYEFVDILVPSKSKKHVKICEICNEPFIQKENEDICPSCLHKTNINSKDYLLCHW